MEEKEYRHSYYKELINEDVKKSKKVFNSEWNSQREWLKEVSKKRLFESGQDAEARKEKALNDYQYFVETYMRHNCERDGELVKMNRIHKNMAQRFTEAKQSHSWYGLFVWARGLAKTTNTAHILLWEMIRGNLDNVVYVSKSMKTTREMIMNIRTELENNELLIHDFGPFRERGIEWSEDTYYIKKYDTWFNALSPGLSPRGTKKGSKRITELVLDDVDTNERCLNDDRMKKLYEWFNDELVPAVSQDGYRVLFIGNRFHDKQLLSYYETKPIDYKEQVNIYDENEIPSWPEYWTKQSIERAREMAGSISFQREMLNKPIIEGAVFRNDWIQFKSINIREMERICMYIDPAWTSNKKSDFKAAVILGVKAGKFYVLDVFVRRSKMSDLVDWVFDKYREIYRLGKDCPIYFESVMNQNILADEFYKREKQTNIRIPFILDKSVKGEKFTRIETLSVYWERLLFWVDEKLKGSSDWREAESQLLAFNKGSKANDDFPDALQSAFSKVNSAGVQTKVKTYDMGFNKYDNY